MSRSTRPCTLEVWVCGKTACLVGCKPWSTESSERCWLRLGTTQVTSASTQLVPREVERCGCCSRCTGLRKHGCFMFVRVPYKRRTLHPCRGHLIMIMRPRARHAYGQAQPDLDLDPWPCMRMLRMQHACRRVRTMIPWSAALPRPNLSPAATATTRATPSRSQASAAGGWSQPTARACARSGAPRVRAAAVPSPATRGSHAHRPSRTRGAC